MDFKKEKLGTLKFTGRMDGRTDGRTDGRADGRTDERASKQVDLRGITGRYVMCLHVLYGGWRRSPFTRTGNGRNIWTGSARKRAQWGYNDLEGPQRMLAWRFHQRMGHRLSN